VLKNEPNERYRKLSFRYRTSSFLPTSPKTLLIFPTLSLFPVIFSTPYLDEPSHLLPVDIQEDIKKLSVVQQIPTKTILFHKFLPFFLRFQKIYVFLQSALSSLAPLWKVNVFTAPLLTRQSTPSRERRCRPYRGGHLGGKIESHDILKRRLRASCL